MKRQPGPLHCNVQSWYLLLCCKDICCPRVKSMLQLMQSLISREK